jgi:D-hydroxyproline dehydrogenase subunit gamma
MSLEPEVVFTADGETVSCPADITVAAALLNLGKWRFRRSVSGRPRAPLCGMGTCHECLVTVDGDRHRRACMVPVRPGMRIETDD